jgi:hypothetical protein
MELKVIICFLPLKKLKTEAIQTERESMRAIDECYLAPVKKWCTNFRQGRSTSLMIRRLKDRGSFASRKRLASSPFKDHSVQADSSMSTSWLRKWRVSDRSRQLGLQTFHVRWTSPTRSMEQQIDPVSYSMPFRATPGDLQQIGFGQIITEHRFRFFRVMCMPQHGSVPRWAFWKSSTENQHMKRLDFHPLIRSWNPESHGRGGHGLAE